MDVAFGRIFLSLCLNWGNGKIRGVLVLGAGVWEIANGYSWFWGVVLVLVRSTVFLRCL